jgi:hypothetical protein
MCALDLRERGHVTQNPLLQVACCYLGLINFEAWMHHRLERKILEYNRILNQPVWKFMLLHVLWFTICVGGVNIFVAVEGSGHPMSLSLLLKCLAFGILSGAAWALMYRRVLKYQLRKTRKQLSEITSISN